MIDHDKIKIAVSERRIRFRQYSAEMMIERGMNEYMTVCPTCKGSIYIGTAVFRVKIGNGILVLEDVPAEICSLCGEKWFSDEVMIKIEAIANDVRSRHVKFEIITFDAA